MMKLPWWLIAGALLIPQLLLAQNSPAFAWAENINCNASGNAIAVDKNGNVYTTGYFSGTADFDPGPEVNNQTSLNNNQNVFIQKLNKSGELAWVKTFGSASGAEGYGIAVDQSGDLYVAGDFNGKVDFDPGPDTLYLTSKGYAGSFIVKFDSSGNLEWAKNIDGVGPQSGAAIFGLAIDNLGHVYTKGKLFGTADFDPGQSDFTLTALGSNDIFIQKIDTSGNFLWAKRYGGASRNEGHMTLSVDNKGYIYSSVNNLLQKIDSSGNFIWEKNTKNDSLYFILTDAKGNIYGNSSRGNVYKFDTSGAVAWVKRAGGFAEPAGPDMAVDSSGNIYMTGNFDGTLDFDTGPGTFYLTSNGACDIFILKLDNSGDFLWARGFGGEGTSDLGRSITVDMSGNVYATGLFFGTADFDPGSGIYNLTSKSGGAFLIKWYQTATDVKNGNHSAPDFSNRDGSSAHQGSIPAEPKRMNVKYYKINGRLAASRECLVQTNGAYSLVGSGLKMSQGIYIPVIKKNKCLKAVPLVK